MTSSVCSNTAIGDTAQLRDTRDGKYYWVGKLADGKCWMTQNLDLDLSTSKALTPADSDVASNWTPEYTTATVANSSTILASNTGQRSWSLGDYRIINLTASNSCGSGNTSAANCASQLTTYSTPTSANGNADAHYILGNHYQWNAATAGTGGSIKSGQAAGSICPKGWKMPTSTSSGEFSTLITAGSIGSDVSKLTSSPYYFVKGGAIYQNTNSLFNNAGYYGFYWSSTPYSNGDYAYSLTFYENTITPSSSSNFRSDGRSVRCLAR